MSSLYAKEYGLLPGASSAETVKALRAVFAAAKETGKTEVCIAPGVYSVHSADCEKRILHVTNTIGDREYKDGDTPYLSPVVLFLEQLSDLTVSAEGAVFEVDGKATHVVMQHCENITVRGLTFRHVRPDMHELAVRRVSGRTVEFETDQNTRLSEENGTLCFTGTDYCVPVNANAATSYHNGCIRKETPDRVKRVRHPLFGAFKVKQTGEHGISASYISTHRFREGDRFYVYDVHRHTNGVVLDRCKGIRLEEVTQHFNYGLAFVAQDSEDISLDRVVFAPDPESGLQLASVADFLQVCMCRGSFQCTDSFFCGAGDDCMNVHGIHFKVAKVNKEEGTVTVKFMHPQTHGFNPLRPGDTVCFTDPNSLLEQGRATIQKSELVSDTEIQLTLQNITRAEAVKAGMVLEDIDANPAVAFVNNEVNRIITRDVLLTTRGDVVVFGNKFRNSTMSGILISDDAKQWYESGPCKNVEICNNTFGYCGETPVRILPENKVHKGAVHQNIRITGNTFEEYDGPCITAKSTNGLFLQGNTYGKSAAVKTKHCEQVTEESSWTD